MHLLSLRNDPDTTRRFFHHSFTHLNVIYIPCKKKRNKNTFFFFFTDSTVILLYSITYSWLHTAYIISIVCFPIHDGPVKGSIWPKGVNIPTCAFTSTDANIRLKCLKSILIFLLLRLSAEAHPISVFEFR